MELPDWQTLGKPIPRGESWPDKKLYWVRRAAMDQELILEQRETIAKQSIKINQLRLQLEKAKALNEDVKL